MMENESEYLSSCNVCYVKFDLGLLRPKVLPCSHTFCFRCLQTIHAETTLHCPVCRTVIEIDDVAALPNNIYALHIINLNQQLQGALVQKEVSSLYWCFSCEGVVKPDCQDKNHTVLDMSKDLKDLNSKMKQSKTNLRESVNNRRQARAHLEDTLALLKRQVDEIQKEIDDNEKELNKLENMLETESADFSKNRQRIIKRFKKTENALVKSTELTDECSARLEVIKWICTKSDNCSLRRKAYVIRSATLEKDYLDWRVTKRTCLQNTAENKDILVCFSFNPVKPILACGYKSGAIGFFVGGSHSSPFTSWTSHVWKHSDYSITSMDWNALGNEIAFGDGKSGLKIWNTETGEILDYGNMCSNSNPIHLIRWNGKCAPDLLAACSKNNIHIWDVSKSDMIPVMKFDAIHPKSVRCMVWISSEMLATCCVDRKIKIHQVGKLNPVIVMNTWGNVPDHLSWNSSNGKLAFCCFDCAGEVCIWNLEKENLTDQNSFDEERKEKTNILDCRVLCLDWYPSFASDREGQEVNEGCIALGTQDKLVIIFSPPEYAAPSRLLVRHTGVVNSVAFSPDGEYLASLSVGREFIIWSPSEGDDFAVLLILDVSLAFGKNITWSPCCRKITLFSENILDSGINLEKIKIIEISEPNLTLA